MEDIKRVHFAEHKDRPPHSSSKYSALIAAINAYGAREADRLVAKYDREMGDWTQKHYEVGSWVNGPLLYIELLDREDRERTGDPPTIGKGLTNAVLDAGFIPFGFRPETDRTKDEDERHTGRWMWYLVPRGYLDDMYDTEYGLIDEDERFVRNSDGDAVLFEDANDAAAVKNDDQTIRKVWK